MPKSVDEYEAILDRNAIWLERTKGVGPLSADDALALAQSGPMLRARRGGLGPPQGDAVPRLRRGRVRRARLSDGDVYDRYRVHMDEMRESVRIVRQCLDRLDEMDGEPWIADDRKVVLPPRHELHTSMESLIHHFKIVTEGFTVPEGEVYVAIESPRGEAGCYLVSDGGARPWRVKFRAPSFAALQATATIVQGLLIADLIAAARLAGSGHGGRRQMSVDAQIQKLRKQYPDPTVGGPAGAPARAGGARRVALAGRDPRGRGRARGSRPRTACRSRPSTTSSTSSRSAGRIIEVCTNVSCALSGAQQVVEAFERELGVSAGSTSEDGAYTLGTIECLGGCGWATVVAIDNRHRLRVKADDVPGIVEELRSG